MPNKPSQNTTVRRLIINADDLGSGSQRDKGIFRSFTSGIVTSASLLANGPSFATAAQKAFEIGLPLGVHLNLSEGRPLTGALPGLTTKDGLFPGKEGLRRYLSGGQPDPAPLYRELAAQIERVVSTGVHPDHLDSHQHFCLFPAISAVVISVAKEYAVRTLRLPVPAEPARLDPGGALGEELALYRRLAPEYKSLVCDSGITTPAGLFGMPLLNRLTGNTLISTLQRIPTGTWELMVHPGTPDHTATFSGVERQLELEALTMPQVMETLEQCNINTITFGDL
jgi:predicted glycoside hydrolase/deacetylase ChbG (UPF0249 family)